MSKQNKGIWQLRKPEIEVMAKTMTAREIAEHYGVARRHMSQMLIAIGVKAYNPQNVWADRVDELKELAKEMTCNQLAEHYKLTSSSVHEVLRKYGVVAVKEDRKHKLKSYGEEMRELGKTMTIPQIAKHFGRKENTVRDYAKRHGIVCARDGKHSMAYWESEKENIVRMHKTMFGTEIAIEYGMSKSRMRTVMRALGIRVYRVAEDKVAKKRVKKEKKIVVKKQQIEQKKEWKPPVKAVYDVVFPKGVKVQKVKRSTSDDPRCVMSAPIYNPHARTVSARY